MASAIRRVVGPALNNSNNCAAPSTFAPIPVGRNVSDWPWRRECEYISACPRFLIDSDSNRRLQSVANWFQHQRSMAKRRGGAIFTPAAKPVVKPEAPNFSRAVSPATSISTRPKRSRPEQFQLDALKELYTDTATPTMEQRSALAAQLGMTESKVTNWFRNARQSAKAKTKTQPSQLATGSNTTQPESDVEIDEDHQDGSAHIRNSPVAVIKRVTDSASASPLRESNVFVAVDDMDVDERDSGFHTGSDEDEIPTPSPLSSTQALYHSAPKNTSTVDDAALLLNLRTASSS